LIQREISCVILVVRGGCAEKNTVSAWYHVSCHEAQSSKQKIPTSSEKYRSSKGQGGTSPWKASCFWSKMKEFLGESSWSVEMLHFLLLSPVLLVSPLRFMTAYVIPGLEAMYM